MLRIALLSVALGAPLAGCTPAVPDVQRLERYRLLLSQPLAQRVLPADEAVLDRALTTNRTFGDDVRPRAAAPGHPLTAVVREVLAGLPPLVQRLAERTLVAVYLVEGDVGTATAEGVQDVDKRWRHTYLVLNLTALERDANAWATWKERSAFRPSAGYALRMTLEPSESDDRAGAVRFILLHELGHALGLGLGVHGSWEEDDPRPPGARGLSAFSALSWELARKDGKLSARSRFAAAEPALDTLGFYRFDAASHTLAQAPEVYAALERTNFPSLYGATNLYDDFAESFAVYVHTELLGKPYRVEVLREGAVVATYHTCLGAPRCAEKRAALKALLEAPAPAPAEPAAAPTSGPQIRLSVGGGVRIGR